MVMKQKMFRQSENDSKGRGRLVADRVIMVDGSIAAYNNHFLNPRVKIGFDCMIDFGLWFPRGEHFHNQARSLNQTLACKASWPLFF